MTNLTSEQYRDILHNLSGYTVETPSVQCLLRKAVRTFYRHFRCYPEVAAAAPGCGTIFGEQTQFDDGIALALPLPMATVVVGRKVSGPRTTIVTTGDVGRPHKVSFGLSECPLTNSGPVWLNYVKGVMAIYCCKQTVSAFEAAIETSLPLGVGCGSSAGLEVAVFAFLEIMFGRRVHPVDRAIACQFAEEDFLDRTTGAVARICASTAKDRNALLIDATTHDVDWIPFRNPRVVFVIVDPHMRDTLFGEEYPERSKFLKKACDILGVKNLRGLTSDDLGVLEERIRTGIEPLSEEESSKEEMTGRRTLLDHDWDEEKLWLVMKRAQFYVTEMERIQEATIAWTADDVETFGQKMTESHNSLKEDFGFSNMILDFFVETSLQVEGVLGSKMVGLGLDQGGCVMTLLYKENLQQYCDVVKTKFEEHAVEMKRSLKEKEAREMAERLREEEEAARGGKAQNTTVEQEQENTAAGVGVDANLTGEQAADGTTEVFVKKKKKCDPSAKRKKSKNRVESELLSSETKEQIEGTGKRRKEGAGGGKVAEEGQRQFGTENGALQPEAPEGAAEETTEETEVVTVVKEEKEDKEFGLSMPSFYIANPISGARMMFPLKVDLLRSRHAVRIPQAKELVRTAAEELFRRYRCQAEAIGVAPATTTLFGEFLEYSSGYVINMALPVLTVTVGCRNDRATFTMATTSKDVGDVTEFRAPVPCVSIPGVCLPLNSWINYAVGTVSEFRGHVPGFNAVVESSVPVRIGIHSCSAFQGSVYGFLEGLTRTCTDDALEKSERCRRVENRLADAVDPLLSNCPVLRFLPSFLCKEGYVLLINSKNLKMTHHYLDDPSYVFLIACCKERTSSITVRDLGDRIRACQEAADILGKDSLVNADDRHIRCLRKRGASEEVIRRASYVISEQERCARAVRSIQNDEYENLGQLMTQSHCSLRDDFEVSCPEIEKIVNLALSVDGVLGAKLIGRGLASTVLILAELFSADECISYVRKKYRPRRDRPEFYVVKPSSGAFTMDLTELKLVP